MCSYAPAAVREGSGDILVLLVLVFEYWGSLQLLNYFERSYSIYKAHVYSAITYPLHSALTL